MDTSKDYCLFATPNGAVYNSHKCGNIVVDFGNMLIIVMEESFEKLRSLIMSTPKENLNERIVEPFNKIVLQPSEFMGYYAFKKEEFVELQELITGAWSIIEMRREIIQCLG